MTPDLSSATVTHYWPLCIAGPSGQMVVRVKADGTPEFGPGITSENVWQKIAELWPAPSPSTTP